MNTDIKVGDIVKITAKLHGHDFAIGDEVEITKLPLDERDNYGAKKNLETWHILPDEFEKVEWWKDLRPGDYVVNESSIYPETKQGFIYKIIKSQTKRCWYIDLPIPCAPYMDEGWRFATQQEIDLYKTHGKPVKSSSNWYDNLKGGDIVVVTDEILNTSWGNRKEAVGYMFLIKENCLNEFKKGGEICIDPVNRYGINYSIHNTRLATDEELEYYKSWSDAPVHLPVNVPREKMEELLKEAKKKYPIGTEFYAVKGDGKRGGKFTQAKECYLYTNYRGTWIIGSANIYNPTINKWAEIISNKNVMSEKELIAEAKRRYPIGTKFVSPKDFKAETLRGSGNIVTDDNFYMSSVGITSSGIYYVYQDGIWADIVEPTKDEILEIARKKYPPGTRHYGYNNSVKIFEVVGDLHWTGNNIYSTTNGCIYHSATKSWAKIVEESVEEESIKDPVEDTKTELATGVPLLGDFEPILVSEYIECSINNLI